MRHIDRSRFVIFSLYAALMSLVACGAPPTMFSTSVQQERSIRKRITSSCPCLYAAISAKNSVTVYPVVATGNSAPLAKIVGSKTGLDAPFDVALDGSGEIYVLNTGNDSVTIYSSGADHNVSPIRTIQGDQTQMDSPAGIAVDEPGNIYITNAGDSAVTVYAAGGSGNVAPTYTIEGSYTELVKPGQLGVDTSGDIYVPNEECGYEGHGCILVFAAGASGNVTPIRNINGGATKQNQTHALAVGEGKVYVGAIRLMLEYSATENGNEHPIALFGNGIHNPGAQGIALDAGGNIYVSQRDKILVYNASSKDLVRTITGPQTGLDDPQGIAIH